MKLSPIEHGGVRNRLQRNILWALPGQNTQTHLPGASTQRFEINQAPANHPTAHVSLRCSVNGGARRGRQQRNQLQVWRDLARTVRANPQIKNNALIRQTCQFCSQFINWPPYQIYELDLTFIRGKLLSCLFHKGSISGHLACHHHYPFSLWLKGQRNIEGGAQLHLSSNSG